MTEINAHPSRRCYFPKGSLRSGPYACAVDPELAGWTYCGLYTLELDAGDSVQLDTQGKELVVLPLSGSCLVDISGQRFSLQGRSSVFDRVSDFAYVPLDSHASLSSDGGGRFALPWARAQRRLEPAYGPAANVPVEVRGAGSSSRQVNNFLSPSAFPADKLVAVEVLTPGSNWSSYPPHKHDQEGPGEAELEEIYYFEVAGEHGFAVQRLYTPDRRLDLTEEVHSGDVVLVPFGYHGPSMAAPGYDLYYLNVLAGPAPQRTMDFCDDPAHHWIRQTWETQEVDPRVPMTGP